MSALAIINKASELALNLVSATNDVESLKTALDNRKAEREAAKAAFEKFVETEAANAGVKASLLKNQALTAAELALGAEPTRKAKTPKAPKAPKLDENGNPIPPGKRGRKPNAAKAAEAAAAANTAPTKVEGADDGMDKVVAGAKATANGAGASHTSGATGII